MCGCMEARFVHISFNVSVTHLNLGLPTLRFGGIQGVIRFVLGGGGANVMCLTGCSFGIWYNLASLSILLFL